MADILTKIALAGAAASFAAYLAVRHARRIACVSDWLVRVPRSRLAAFLLFAAVATVCAQKGGNTNEPPSGGVELRGGQSHDSTLSTFNSQFRLDSVATNDSYSYAMPTNGTRHEKWWLRGAYEDVFRLDLSGMRFPLGTNLCESLWVYSWAFAGARLCDTSNVVSAAGVPMSAVPRLSRFWSAADADGSRLLTWQDFALGRDTNELVSAQLKLMPTGDFVARSNEIARTFRRVNPDDWDDDGIPNDEDDDPYHYDGDNFGPGQVLWEGANSNAYYFVDIVVSGANALVRFRGDGYSTLPDPQFVARPGETNRVMLLIGKTYTVTCDMPIDCTWVSDTDVEVHRSAPNRLQIVWPVEIWSVDYGSYFEMFVTPDWLNGQFAWSTNGCCEITGSGTFYSFLCGGNCGCDGCHISGDYIYEGYDINMFSGECGCEPVGEHEEEGGSGVQADFSQKVLFYEDEYYDEALGVTIPAWTGETVALKCSVSGGPYGGVFRLALENIDKLSRIGGDALPTGDVDVPANTELSWRAVYTFAEHSDSEDDVTATATFTENLSGEEMTDDDSMTVVMLTPAAVALWPTNMVRKTFGVGEKVNIYKTPNIQVTATASRGRCEMSEGGDVHYTCPHSGDDDDVVITAKECSHTMEFNIREPERYVVITAMSNFTAVAGESGGFGIDFRCRLLPRSVSFKNVEVIELPRVATDAAGYYAQPSKAGLLDHGNHGAGKWVGVNLYNVVTDETFMEKNPPPWLGGGSFTWPIPNAWRVAGDNVEGTIFCNTDQRFELDADGTARLKKFRYTGERMTNGVYRQTRTN